MWTVPLDLPAETDYFLQVQAGSATAHSGAVTVARLADPGARPGVLGSANGDLLLAGQGYLLNNFSFNGIRGQVESRLTQLEVQHRLPLLAQSGAVGAWAGPPHVGPDEHGELRLQGRSIILGAVPFFPWVAQTTGRVQRLASLLGVSLTEFIPTPQRVGPELYIGSDATGRFLVLSAPVIWFGTINAPLVLQAYAWQTHLLQQISTTTTTPAAPTTTTTLTTTTRIRQTRPPG